MAENGKTWFRLRWRTLFLLVVLGIVGWSAYSYWSEYSERAARRARELMSPEVGARCTVEFLGDKPAYTGRFLMLNDRWLVFREDFPNADEFSDSQLSRTWIPRESVRLMRVEAK